MTTADPSHPEVGKQPPRVFISYTHESREHKQWVTQLATDLRGMGIDVVIDHWDLQLGEDVTLFMERSIASADRTLLICTPTYGRKANDGIGGVGYERMVVTSELAKNINTSKFICVLRSGANEESIPRFAGTRLWIDFRAEALYEESRESLARVILDAPRDPKPPIGPNPFVQPPAAIGPVATLGSIPPIDSPTDNTEVAYATAERILRQRDFLAWHRYVRQMRVQLGPGLLKWRRDAESGQLTDQRWAELRQSAVALFSPLIVLALSAVESEHREVRRQQGLIDDLMSIEGWNPGGITAVVEIPYALSLAYHQILGAFLVQQGHAEEAIELINSAVAQPRGGKVSPIWQTGSLIGWTNSLAHSSVVAWDWVVSLWDSCPWLGHFFASKSAYREALSSYLLGGSLLELGFRVKHPDGLKGISRSIPPYFLPDDGSDLGRLVAKVVPTAQHTANIARIAGISEEQFRKEWPGWAVGIYRDLNSHGGRWVRVPSEHGGTVPPLP